MNKVKIKLTICGICIILFSLIFATMLINNDKNSAANAEETISLDSIVFTDPEAFQFTPISDDECSVKLIDKTLKNVRVPYTTTINGTEYSVSEVAANGFSSSAALETIILPNVTKINSVAFQNCKNLNVVYAPKVTEIGMSAFAMCPNLTDIIFPSTLETVGASVFMMNETTVHARFDAVPSGWASNWNTGNKVTTHDFNGRDENGDLWKHDFIYEEINGSPLTRTSSASSMRLAPLQPFMEQTSQGHLEIPATETDILPYTFVDGTFDSITILSSDTPINISSMAFSLLKVNEGITINRDVTYNCSVMGGESIMPFNSVDTPFITLPASGNIVTGMFFENTVSNINFRTSDGINYENIGTVRLPDSVTAIKEQAFYNTKNIKHLYLTSNITSIENDAFYGWDSSQTIHMPFFSEAQAIETLGTAWKTNNAAKVTYLGELTLISQPYEICDTDTHSFVYELKVDKNIYSLDQFTATLYYTYWDKDTLNEVLTLDRTETTEQRGDYWVKTFKYDVTLKPTSTGASSFTFDLRIYQDDKVVLSKVSERVKVHRFVRTLSDFEALNFDSSDYGDIQYDVYLLSDLNLGSFSGTAQNYLIKNTNTVNIYGNDHTVTYQINIASVPAGRVFNLGLFAENKGIISDLNVDANITVSNYAQNGVVKVGGIASANATSAQILNSSVSINAYINANLSHIGGITGENSGIVSYCDATGAISSSSAPNGTDTGGIAYNNKNKAQIIGCISKVNITTYGNSGGIAAQNSGIISDCRNEGALTYNYAAFQSNRVTYRSTGGIIGYNQGTCTSCVNAGTIKFGKSDTANYSNMQPRMAQIIGTDHNGTRSDNSWTGTVVTTGLNSTQLTYVKNAECGRIE